jgi:MoaA/NifB/PqqE/SkfB family radical SAM enzyme
MTYIDPPTKVLQHLDRLAEIKAGNRPPPVNVEIDLSNRCSLGCEWCHFAYTHTRGPLAGKVDKPDGAVAGGDMMDFYLMHKILDQLESFGVRSIVWSGGGEPTLHPDFNYLIAYCKLDQGIYTHGGHINATRAGLMKQRMIWVYVSLDAHDAESYAKHKGVDRFDAACDGVRHLVAADGDATIGVGFMLTGDNYLYAPKMLAVGRGLGADFIQFRPAVIYDQQQPGKVGEFTGWSTGAAEWLKGIAKEPDVELDLERFRMYGDWLEHPYSTCWWSALSTVITPNGKVWTCCNKRERSHALMGDLTVDSFADIWNRTEPHKVNGECRVLCRGHIPNLTLDKIMMPAAHGNFI